MMEVIKVTVEMLEPMSKDLFQLRNRNAPRSVSLRVHKSTTLGEIIDRAAIAIGLELTEDMRALLLKLQAESGGPPRTISSLCPYFAIEPREGGSPVLLDKFAVMDNQGRAEWHIHYGVVTHEQLCAAVEEGLLDGDPSRIYLIPRYRAGGGAEIWLTFFTILNTICTVYSWPGATQATNDTLRQVFRRLRRGYEIAEREANNLAERNASPEDIRALLERNRWTTQQAARLLDTSEEAAIAWLELFGFRDGGDGRWSLGGDDVSNMVRGSVQFALYNRGTYLGTGDLPENDLDAFIDARLRAIVEEPIRRYVESGEVPQFPTEDDIVRWEMPS